MGEIDKDPAGWWRDTISAINNESLPAKYGPSAGCVAIHSEDSRVNVLLAVGNGEVDIIWSGRQASGPSGVESHVEMMKKGLKQYGLRVLRSPTTERNKIIRRIRERLSGTGRLPPSESARPRLQARLSYLLSL